MNHYLVIKTEVDKEENLNTEVVLKYKKLEAEVEFFSMIDNFYSRLIQDNKIMHFEEFNVADFGDEERGHFVFEFKDYEGEINLKIEMKTI